LTQTLQQPTQSPGSAGEGLQKRGGAVLGDRAFWVLTLVSGLLVLAILALILYVTLRNAWPIFQDEGLKFFTSSVWIPNDPDGPEGPRTPEFGALAFIYGSLVVSLIAMLIAVPVSVGIALCLTELAPPRVRTIAITIIDLLAAIPSVVFGLWAILVFAPGILPAYTGLHDTLGRIPVLGALFGTPNTTGRGFLTAGIILAAMIIPIITSITREVFATVPTADKQAALALGATRWEMIRGAVFPHSFGGVVGAVMLGLGRALGETIAVFLIIGASVQITPNLLETGNALPAVIVQNWNESSGLFQAALLGCGVVLFLVTVIINYLARVIVRRTELRMKGA
jgi:phosphate transport system permease protein